MTLSNKMKSVSHIGNINRLYMAFMVTLLIGLASCRQDTAVVEDSKPTKAAVKVPAVNGDTLYSFVEKQLSFGHRIPGTAEHKACRDWIIDKLESYGAQTQVQEFKASFYDVVDADAYNIIATFNPDKKHRVLLAAHWDSRMVAEKDPELAKRDEAIMGADDSGSGVAGLLEIARVISQNPIDLGIDLIFFDAEDNGTPNKNNKTWCLGSQYWAKNMHDPDYKAKFGILLDMIGAKGATFGKEGISQRYAKRYHDKIWNLGQRMGYTDLFVDTPFGGIEDDHVYVNQAGIPMLDIINYDLQTNKFAHYHHTHKDDISVIDKRILRVVTQVVTAAIYKESTYHL